MVARPGIVGMEIIHNCRVLQPVRRLHQQRSAIGTRVLVAEVMSGTKIFHHAIPLVQIGGKPKGDTVINNRQVDRALKLARIVISVAGFNIAITSEEHTTELQLLMSISYVVSTTKKK